jgi:hypothetical protein
VFLIWSSQKNPTPLQPVKETLSTEKSKAGHRLKIKEKNIAKHLVGKKKSCTFATR